MEIDLSGKTAVVTGGNIGIGAGIAKNLANCGVSVVITYYSHDAEAKETVEAIKGYGVQTGMFQLDATDSNQVDDMMAKAAEFLGGKINILVNNAGHLVNRITLDNMSNEHWHQVIDVNLSSAFYCCRAALNYMGEGGRIVNMSSLAGRNGGGHGTVAYAASKAGIIGFTRGLAKELAPKKITVNALAPGFIVDTPFHETFTGVENYERVVSGIPLGVAGVPDDVAGAVLYYVSDLGKWVTGQVAEINGGAWFI